MRKLGGEVCDRDLRKDQKEHKIPALTTEKVREKLVRPCGWRQRGSRTSGGVASRDPGAGENRACYPPEAAIPSREQLASPASLEHGARCPQPQWAMSLARGGSGARLSSGQRRLWRFLPRGSRDSHGGVSIGSAPPAGLRWAPARAAVGEGK